MEFLGIGAPELIFILLIAIIVLGPKDMQKAGQTIGRWLNQLVRSEGWRALQQTSREIRKLPTTLMREANVGWQETEQAIRQGLDTDPKRSADLRRSRTNEIENTIQPPPPKPQIQETDEDNGGNESERHD
ncbi:MAG TPA: hypothetical protein VFC02_21730 [Anaerolineales bacterium]|nr:hypothetical protein [Anaerolineales bacterium]